MWRIFSSIEQMTRKNWRVIIFFFCNWTHPLHTSLHFCSKQENPNLAVAYGFKHSDFWTLTWSVKRLTLSFLPLLPKDGLSLWGGKEDKRILRYLSGSEEGNRQEGQGSPGGEKRLQVPNIFISLKWQEERNQRYVFFSVQI